jgi:hypoxanthine phosphoribosyltransferase
MKSIPDIDLVKAYYNCPHENRSYRKTIDVLISELKIEKNPFDYKNKFLAMIQLYFDGIIDGQSEEVEKTEKQKQILENLCLAGKNLIGSFYTCKGIDFDAANKIIFSFSEQIIKYSKKSIAKIRHLEPVCSDVQKFAKLFFQRMEGKKFDSITCISSGGFEPGFLLMYMLEKDELIPVRYSRVARCDTDVRLPLISEQEFEHKIKDKNILVAEDWIGAGVTFSRTMEFIAEKKPAKLFGTAVKCHQFELPYISVSTINQYNPLICKYEGEKWMTMKNR